MPKKPVALSVASINIDQRVLEDVSMEHKNDSSTYKIHNYTNKKFSSCEQVRRNAMFTIEDTDKNE